MNATLAVRAALAATALAGVLALTGCTATPAPAASSTSAGATAATAAATQPAPTPTETPTPAPAPIVAGQTLTAAQAATPPAGVRPYAMPDGTIVAVVDGQPVPAPVVAQLAAPVAAATAALTGQDAAHTVYDAAMAQVSATYKATGLDAVVVFKGRGATGYAYNVTGGAKMRSATSDKGTAMAAAQAYVAAQAHPEAFIIIDGTGE